MTQYDKRTAREDMREIARVSLLASGLSVAACVMGLILASTYGATAAKIRVANAASAIAASDIAGRWSGSYHSYGAARAKCEGGPCKLTLDVTACDKGWCGVMVKEDGSCGGVAMTVQASQAQRQGRDDTMRFDGRLELNPKAASYAIEATLWASEAGVRNIDVIGDTGKDLVMMRRSFPFSAHLARAGEAVCTTDKATS